MKNNSSSINNDLKKRLFLFTDEFPWGYGEKSFVAPELNYLKRYFQVIIVSLAPEEYLEQYELITNISPDVRVVHYSRSSLSRRLLLGFKLMLSKIGVSEISSLKKQGFSLGRFASALYALGNAEDLRRYCDEKGLFSDIESSIYYAFWFNTQCLALAIEKSSRNQLKLVARLHGYDLFKERRRYCYQPFQEFKRDMCDRVFFACKYSLEYFREEFGSERFKGQYQLNYLGVESRNRICKESRDGKFRIVSCSRIDKNKRVELIAKALSYLDNKKYTWVHFGDGELRGEVEAIAKKNNLTATFKGNVSNSEIIKYYSSNPVDVFLTTTATEGGCPVSIQEALSFGIPVIGTKVGGIPEAVDGNGLLLENDPKVLSVVEAIKKIALSTDEEIEAMKNRSLELWRSRFDIRTNKEQLINMLRKA